MTLTIRQFPCLNDNYGYLIHNARTDTTACIDTPEEAPIIQALNENFWTLDYIFNTHHHYDHVGCNLALKDRYGAQIIGPEIDRARIPGIDKGVRDGETFLLGDMPVRVMETPGHTLGHIIYYIPDAEAAFVGDTIFTLGCGRLFEGTPQQMFDSFNKIKTLPEETRLYCAHEYTLANAAFAKTVDPDGRDLRHAIKNYVALRESGFPTVPTTLSTELLTNPFLRAQTPEELGRLRAAKDVFKA